MGTNGKLCLSQAIFQRFSPGESLNIGDMIVGSPDRLLVHDAYLTDIEEFLKSVGASSQHSDKVVATFDHAVPPANLNQANNLVAGLAFVRREQFRYAYPFEGICHQLLAEHGHFLPGFVITGTDSHTVAAGAFGTLGIGIPPAEAAEVMITGKTWIRVPEKIDVEVNGRLGDGVTGRDLSLALLRELKGQQVDGKLLMLFGSAIDSLGVADRLALAIMMAECGCLSVLMMPNAEVWNYLRTRVDPSTFRQAEERFQSMGAASPTPPGQIRLDISSLTPQVAPPYSPSNGQDVGKVAGEAITQAFIGSCAGGRLEDLAAAAKVLRGKKVHPNVRLVVIPASRDVVLRALREGILEVLYEAGAMVLNPGCGLCGGFHQGLVGAGDVMISTQSRNFKARSGSADARIFLASAATVAASAVEGVICDPRPMLFA